VNILKYKWSCGALSVLGIPGVPFRFLEKIPQKRTKWFCSLSGILCFLVMVLGLLFAFVDLRYVLLPRVLREVPQSGSESLIYGSLPSEVSQRWKDIFHLAHLIRLQGWDLVEFR